MARIHALTGLSPTPLDRAWQMAMGQPGVDTPAATCGLDWLPATVPGTAAQALADAGISDPALLAGLHEITLWYRCPVPPGGPRLLHCEGLAGLCTIWLDDVVVGHADNAFTRHDVLLENQSGATLCLEFRPLSSAPAQPIRRQRWRPHLVATPALRHHRQSLIGHMPGWCPAVVPVGPFRPVRLVDAAAPAVAGLDLTTRLDGTTGRVECSIDIQGLTGPFRLRCGDHDAPLDAIGGDRYVARLTVPDVRRWWPHTHGEPHLYRVEITSQTDTIDLGTVGFRELACDRGADGRGFGLIVNGVPVFCRGTNWTSPDILRLAGGREAYRPLLDRARAAGMNMLRIPGLMAAETPDLTELCDELGILVWQDMMFANFDYDFGPSSAGGAIAAELDHFLAERQACPSLAVISGGSELAQQPAMLSLPEAVWSQPMLTETLPALLAARRPDVIGLPTSPWGGDLPFAVSEGVSHYFGVGAYRRPLEDARRARVRFAAECLAFANLPMPDAMPALDPSGADWKALVVRDLRADWDFEDVRDHYTALLYGVDPQRLKRDDPARYIRLAAATSGEVMEMAYAEWRRVGSETAGALVWTLNDVAPGFGWGVLGPDGAPKPAWFALRRAFRPVQVAITDEGLDGLSVHCLNETPVPRALRLTLTAYGADGAPVIDGAREITLAPRSARCLTSAALFGVFFDITHAYRFGPPVHVVSVARLDDPETGAVLAEAFHFPHGRGAAMDDPGLTATVGTDEAGAFVDLVTIRPAQSVMLSVPGFEPEDNDFHLAPGQRRLRLAGAGVPTGTACALNAAEPLRF